MRTQRLGEEPNPIRRGLRHLGKRLDRQGPAWQPSPELFADWEAARAIPRSPLVQVVGIGRTVVSAELAVELLAIEVREQGAVIYWRARSAREGVLLSADVSIADDRGTPYHAILGGGGGNAQAWEGQTLVQPAPTAGARLTITLASFGPNDEMPLPPHVPAERIFGPWVFEVEMPPRDIHQR